MGLTESFETIIVGVILLLVISAVISGIMPQLVIYLGNASVFPMGDITLGLAGLLTLIFVIALVLRVFKQSNSERNAVSNVFNRGDEGL